MDRFHEMAVFVAVAEEGSFSGAAKRLKMSAPAVTRAVAGLEARLDIQMLCRTTRHVRMTTAGQRYLDDARPILEDLEVADETLLGASESPSGEVTMVVPSCISRHFIAPIVAEYLKRYPETQVSIVSVDRAVDLEKEGFDFGIRFGVLPDEIPHAKVGEIRDVFCATPTYLAAHGKPDTPADLARHTLIDNPMRESTRRWSFQKDGMKIPIETTPRVSLSNQDACLVAVSHDFGIAQLASYQVSESISTGAYEIVLEDYETPPYPINVVVRSAHPQSARTKTFFDFVVKRLRSTPKLQSKSNDKIRQRNSGSLVPFRVTPPHTGESATRGVDSKTPSNNLPQRHYQTLR